MNERLIYQDLEGDFVAIDTPEGTRYARQLLLTTAWHFDAPADLAFYCRSLVDRVEEDWERQQLVIHYQPSVQPVSHSKLDDLLRVDLPLASWRLARLAADLTVVLEKLHEAEIFQLSIGPARIGILEDRFVLLPSFAGILPPFSADLKESSSRWLPYIAPEVLRTRGKNEARRFDLPLASWRLARLAADLTVVLEKLHEAEIFQLSIGPARIGILEDRFVLLPSFAGILPPFSADLKESSSRWLPYIAPEVLRTRGKNEALFRAGDVYALGRTLWFLLHPGTVASSIDDPLGMAEQIVESPIHVASLTSPAEFGEIAGIITPMCAPLPADRPALEEVKHAFQAAIIQLDPERAIRERIDTGQLQDAYDHLEALKAQGQESVFVCAPAKIHVLSARLAMAQVPPKYARAIDQLQKAKGYEPQNVRIYQQIGNVYRQFTSHPQHLKLAELAYRDACRLSQWRTNLVDEWLKVLEQLPPELLLKRTKEIPQEQRGVDVLIKRANSFLAAGRAQRAWHACIDFFEEYGFNESMYQIGTEATEQIQVAVLLSWMTSRHNVDKLPAAQSIVWARAGDLEKAAEYFALALSQTEEA